MPARACVRGYSGAGWWGFPWCLHGAAGDATWRGDATRGVAQVRCPMVRRWPYPAATRATVMHPAWAMAACAGLVSTAYPDCGLGRAAVAHEQAFLPVCKAAVHVRRRSPAALPRAHVPQHPRNQESAPVCVHVLSLAYRTSPCIKARRSRYLAVRCVAAQMPEWCVAHHRALNPNQQRACGWSLAGMGPLAGQRQPGAPIKEVLAMWSSWPWRPTGKPVR